MYSSGRFRLSLQCKRFFIFWSLLTVMVLAIYSKWNSLLQYNLVLVIFTKLVAYNIPINCSISSRVNFSRVAGVTWIDYLLDSSKMKSRMELSKKNLIETNWLQTSQTFFITLSLLEVQRNFWNGNGNGITRCATFFKFCYSVSDKTFFKGIYVMCMKKNCNFLHFSVLWFFTKLNLSILYKQLPCSFQLPEVLDCSFN